MVILVIQGVSIDLYDKESELQLNILLMKKFMKIVIVLNLSLLKINSEIF